MGKSESYPWVVEKQRKALGRRFPNCPACPYTSGKLQSDGTALCRGEPVNSAQARLCKGRKPPSAEDAEKIVRQEALKARMDRDLMVSRKKQKKSKRLV